MVCHNNQFNLIVFKTLLSIQFHLLIQQDDIIIDEFHISAESFKNHCITDTNALKMLTSFIWILGTEDACRIMNWKQPAFVKKNHCQVIIHSIILIFYKILVLMVCLWYKTQCPLFNIISGEQNRYHVDPYQLLFFGYQQCLTLKLSNLYGKKRQKLRTCMPWQSGEVFGASMQFSSRVAAVPPSNGKSRH